MDRTIRDDYGPPAGYARFTGRVTNAAGAPVPALNLTVTRCSHPLADIVAMGRTSADGVYHITGMLPPVGVMLPGVRVDTIRARCVVFINYDPAPVDSLDVRFAADSLSIPPQVLNIALP